MLIDNKSFKDNFPKTIFDFFQKYIQTGNFKLVSGFFSASMFAKFFNNFAQITNYKMILGNITKDDKGADKIINLLHDGTDILSAISLKQNAADAVLGIRESSNFELNTADLGANADYKEID